MDKTGIAASFSLLVLMTLAGSIAAAEPVGTPTTSTTTDSPATSPATPVAPAATEASSKGTPANPDTTFDKERFTKEVLKSKDLPNFHQVHPYLYRSGEPTQLGLKQAHSKGIRTLIDLRGGDKSREEAVWAKSLGLKYINLPMSSEPPTKKQVDTFLKEVKDSQANPAKGAVLVHCAHGSDRTGAMVGIWRVTQDKWNYPDTYKEMRHYWFTPKFTKLSGAVKQHAQ